MLTGHENEVRSRTDEKLLYNKEAKYSYCKLKSKSTDDLIKIINANSYRFVITDTRKDLFLLLIDDNLMSISETELRQLRKSPRKTLEAAKKTMKEWGEEIKEETFDAKK